MNEIEKLLQEANDICDKLGAKNFDDCITILEKNEDDINGKQGRARNISEQKSIC